MNAKKASICHQQSDSADSKKRIGFLWLRQELERLIASYVQQANGDRQRSPGGRESLPVSRKLLLLVRFSIEILKKKF